MPLPSVLGTAEAAEAAAAAVRAAPLGSFLLAGGDVVHGARLGHVGVRAAEFLGSIKAVDPMPTLYGVVNTAETEQTLMIAFNTIVFLRDQIGHEYDPSKVKLKFDKGEVYRRVQYLAGTEPNTNY